MEYLLWIIIWMRIPSKKWLKERTPLPIGDKMFLVRMIE